MHRASIRILALLCLCATITAEIQKLDPTDVQRLNAATAFVRERKIVLVGHSWSSILGIFMAKTRPDLFSAFVGTGQVADPQRNYAVAYDALLEKATRLGEARAIRELKDVGPPPYADDRGYGVQRR